MVINGIIITSAMIAVTIVLLFICGIRAYIVSTGSMEPQIPIGSMCFINQNCDFQDIQCGDVITFRISESTVVTHRAVRIDNNAIITRGDANSAEDENAVTAENYIGKYILSIPKAGYVVRFIKSIYGIVAVSGLILMLIIADKILDYRKLY